MEQDASFRGHVPIQFQEPLAAALPSLQTTPYLFLWRRAPKNCAIGWVSGVSLSWNTIFSVAMSRP